MFEKSLKQAVLRYIGAKPGTKEEKTIDDAFEVADSRRREFEKRRRLIVEEIENGTKRSSGKLPI